MQKNNKEKRQKTLLQKLFQGKAASGKKNSSIKSFILFVVLLFGCLSYVIWLTSDSWLGLINRVKLFNQNNSYSHDVKNIDNNIAELIFEEPVILKNHLPSEKLSIEEELQEEFPLPNKLDESCVNYKKLIKEARKRAENDKSVCNNIINNYRIYLSNIHEILYKFSKNYPYSENLVIAKQVPLPKEFAKILIMFEQYNKMLLENNNNNDDYQEVKLFTIDILNKFFKIEKETNSYRETKLLRIQIENNIDLFISYIFSQELQQQFFDLLID